MSGNLLRFIHPVASDAATLSASPALAATLPVANLQDVSRARVARSTGLHNPQYIRGNFAQVEYISALVLNRHNLTSAGTMQLKIWDGLNQTGNLTHDSGVVELGNPLAWGDFTWGIDPWGGDSFAGWPVAFSSLWFTAALALSFELQIIDLANGDGFYEAARLYMGAYWSPASNMSFGHALGWQEQSTQERTGGGTLRTDGEDPYRRWEFDLANLSAGDRGWLVNTARTAGLRKDLFLSMFPEAGGETEQHYAGGVKFVQMPGVIQSSAVNWRSRERMILEEA